MIVVKVISGGQTGADQAALRAARRAGIETGGFAPHGWRTEDGAAPWLAEYGLVPFGKPGDYKARTAENVRTSSATLWFGNPHSPGGRCTMRACVTHNKDSYVVTLMGREDWTEPDGATPRDVADWILGTVAGVPDSNGETRNIRNESGEPVILNVAGNRQSKRPGIGAKVEAFLDEVFRLLAAE